MCVVDHRSALTRRVPIAQSWCKSTQMRDQTTNDDGVAAESGAAQTQHGGRERPVLVSAVLTLRRYAEAVAGWIGRPATLRFVPWNELCTMVDEEDAAICDHVADNPHCSSAKAPRLLDNRPRYSSLKAVHGAPIWLMARDVIDPLPPQPLRGASLLPSPLARRGSPRLRGPARETCALVSLPG